MGIGIKTGKTIKWWIKSSEDPRWNWEGTTTLNRGGGPPVEVVLKLEEFRDVLGETPEDLDWGYSASITPSKGGEKKDERVKNKYP